MAKTKNQIIEERRVRREVKAHEDALKDLKEKNQRSKNVNSAVRESGLTISKEFALCRALFNKVWPINKPDELVEWNKIVDGAKELAEDKTSDN